MKYLIADLKRFIKDCKSEDFAFYMASAYLIFSYLRPQTIYTVLDILPWTQLSIVCGLIFLLIKSRIKVQKPHIAVFIFFLVALASCFTSQYPDFSFKKVNVVYIWLVEIFFFTNCIRSPKQYWLITVLLFLILFKISLFGARTWIQRGFGFRDYGIAGPEGFFANSGELSLLMAMLVVMSISFISGHERVNKWYYILPVTAIMTVLAASSRGGQLAMAGGLLMIGVTIGKLRIRNILVLCIVAFIGFSLIPEKQKERFTTMGDDDTSKSRILYWKAGLEMLEEYPFLGTGYYTFPLYFKDHYSFEMDQSSYLGQRSEVAHNSLIQTASTMGYTGLVVYLYLQYLCYSINRDSRKRLETLGESNEKIRWMYKYSKGLDAAIVTYFIGAFFMSVAFYPYIYLLLQLTQSMNNSIREAEKSIQLHD